MRQLKFNLSQLIDQLNQIHKNKYDYSLVDWQGGGNRIEIICSIHGSFWQRPHNHISHKQGCPKCKYSVSNKEEKWLDLMNIDKINRQKYFKIGKNKIIADGYDPSSNTIYLFHGDYWHGNPDLYDRNKLNKNTNKTFGELYDKTKMIEKLILDEGYNLVVIWENEYNRLGVI